MKGLPNKNRERGRVRWWKEEKGYDRITAPDGEIVFCHFSAIEADGYRALVEGDVVEYERAWSISHPSLRFL